MAAPSRDFAVNERLRPRLHGRARPGAGADTRRLSPGLGPVAGRLAEIGRHRSLRAGAGLWRLAVGAGAVLVPAVLLALLHPRVPVTEPGMILVVAIALSVYLADVVGGVTSLVLAAVLLNVLFVGDRSAFSLPRDSVEATGFITTLLAGGGLVWLIGRIKRESGEDRVATAAARAAANALMALETVTADQAAGAPVARAKVLDALLTAMVRVNRAHAGALFLKGDDEEELVRAAAYGLDAPDGAVTRARIDDGFVGRVAHERRPLVSDDLLADPTLAGDPLRAAGVRAALGVPIMAGDGQLLGVAHLGLLVPHRFTTTDIARLEALARRAAALLESARAVDERELLLEHARENQRRLRLVIAAMPEAVVLAAPPDGRIVAYNDAAERFFGPLSGDDRDLRILDGLVLPDGQPPALDQLPLVRAMRTGDVANGVELLVSRPDGMEVPVLASAAPVREPDGSIAVVVGVFQDIGPLKEASRLKDEFVSIVSHELRSPLTPIRGFAQLVARELEREGGHERHVRRLRSLESQVDRMTRLVDDLLDVSRLRAGRLEIRPAPTDLITLCQDILQARQPGATNHQLELVAAVPFLVGHWDPDRLHQVIDNLVGNAIKYSPDGGVVSLAVAEDGATGHAIVQVTDQGPGIPPADRDHVFSAFYRTKDAAESRTAGLGLGLFICHELVVAHAGTIEAGEAPGGGALFTLRLPLAGPVAA